VTQRFAFNNAKPTRTTTRAQAGGGIGFTVGHTRTATEEELLGKCVCRRARVQRALVSTIITLSYSNRPVQDRACNG
jgi:hypothetical protein